MITLTLTNFSGTSKKMEFDSESNVHKFISNLENNLDTSQAVKVTCDVLGISGILRGNK